MVAILGFLAAVLSGCERGVDVEISGSMAAPEFNVIGGFQGQPAIDDVAVRDGGQLVWSIWRSPSCLPASHFRYGDAPAGWRTMFGPTQLQDRRVYTVTVHGCGNYGGRAFKFVGGKIVSAPGTADGPQKVVETNVP